MLLHHTLERLHELRLRGMAEALEEQLNHSAATEIGFEDRLGMLVERELTWRDNRRLQRLLQEARLRVDASIEDVNFRAARGLDRSVLMRLGSCEWIRQSQVVLIVGPTGVGKTYLACALGQAACRRGLSTRYFRMGRLCHRAVKVYQGRALQSVPPKQGSECIRARVAAASALTGLTLEFRSSPQSDHAADGPAYWVPAVLHQVSGHEVAPGEVPETTS
jgi:hypothetical protein